MSRMDKETLELHNVVEDLNIYWCNIKYWAEHKLIGLKVRVRDYHGKDIGLAPPFSTKLISVWASGGSTGKRRGPCPPPY